MHISVFGAGGKVGRLVVEELLRRGHSITAFVHRHSPFEASERLRIARGDIHVADDVAKALEGSDAVISALGSWGTPGKDILTTAMGSICPIMKDSGIRRIVSLTGAEARADGDKLTAMHRVFHGLLGVVAGKVLADGERHIGILEQSGLDYTVIRSPIMTGSRASTYVLQDQRPLPWATVSRAAVVAALVDAVESSASGLQTGNCPFIANGPPRT